MDLERERDEILKKLREAELESDAMRKSLGHCCDICGAVVKLKCEPFTSGELESRDAVGNVVEHHEWVDDLYVTFDCPNCGPRRMLWHAGK